VSDPNKPDAADSPSLSHELDELQSPTTVQELEIAHESASAVISQAVAEATGPAPNGSSTRSHAPFIDFEDVSIGFGDQEDPR
jgi:hypothetical protein